MIDKAEAVRCATEAISKDFVLLEEQTRGESFRE
jgi:hypothetical protein